MTKERFKDICIIALALIILFGIFKTCNKEPKPYTPIDLKPEIKAQDSFRNVINNLHKRGDSLELKARKKDSIADRWENKYLVYRSKFLKQKDSLPCYTQIVTIIQSCDSLRYKDSLRDLAWKKVHENDSTQMNAFKLNRGNDSVIQKKQAKRIQSDSILIGKLNRKVRFWKCATKVAFGSGACLGVIGGAKVSKINQ